jgi:hypothetical protein
MKKNFFIKKICMILIIISFLILNSKVIGDSNHDFIQEESNESEHSFADPWAYFEKPTPKGLYFFDKIDAEFPFCLIIGKITIVIAAGCWNGELDKVELYVDGKIITFYDPPYEYVWSFGHHILNYVEVTAYAENAKANTGFPLIRFL